MPAPDPFLLPDPIRLTGDELGGAEVPTDALRTTALAYAREHLQGTVVFNGPTGWAVAIGRRGINKTLNHAARREHVQSVPALRALLERAALVFSEANRDAAEARNVPYVYTLLVHAARRSGRRPGRGGRRVPRAADREGDQ